jgi:hypothetical protein
VNSRQLKYFAVAASLLGVTLTLGGTGCSKSRGQGACYPSPLRLSVQKARIGLRLTVSSAAFACRASYPAGKTYTVVLNRAPGPQVLAVVPVNRDGSFTAAVRIPADASAGYASILVRGSAFDRPCKDGAASCASYGTPVVLVR